MPKLDVFFCRTVKCTFVLKNIGFGENFINWIKVF